ncbi:MAG TPA: glycosyltransferase family 4 protein [Candidatus Paceibacterota bacterium]|nr:glycosyltransferase family 4 protein [Candidatus Paceibacterota bacterium]
MNKKLIYIANIRLPTEKAHGIQIMKMCEAFADQGLEVELIVSSRKTPITENPFDYYDVRENFRIKKLWSIDAIRFGRIGFLIQSFTFAKNVSWHALFKKGTFYTRDEMVAFYLRILGKKVIWESHAGQANFFVRMLIRINVPLVVITKGLADVYMHTGVSPKNIHVAPDGVDIKQFDIKENKDEARTRLGFNKEEKIVLYTGHLYSWKGTDTLAEAAQSLPKDVMIYFVGGTENDILSFKKKYRETGNIRILGRKPHHEIPLYMRAADILVIPNSSKQDISRLYTSPMKLFEYMASGAPIVASDLPSLREILNESDAFFFVPDDAKDLLRAIVGVFADQRQALKKAALASEEVKEYSWQKRAKDILSFIKT